jgi:hypothetical protein
MMRPMFIDRSDAPSTAIEFGVSRFSIFVIGRDATGSEVGRNAHTPSSGAILPPDIANGFTSSSTT